MADPTITLTLSEQLRLGIAELEVLRDRARALARLCDLLADATLTPAIASARALEANAAAATAPNEELRLRMNGVRYLAHEGSALFATLSPELLAELGERFREALALAAAAVSN